MMLQPLLSRRELLSRRLILIYQLPKIGSQTIEATLRQSHFPYPVQRFHYLSRAFAKTIRHGLASPTPEPAWKRDAQQQLDSIQVISRIIWLRKVLRLCGFNIPKLEVITGARELISLVLASIFENYLYFAPDLESLTVDRCREAILHPKTFKTLKDWFELELQPFVGIDVYKSSFRREEGYAVYENRFARLLVYRYEAVQRLPQFLGDFLGCKIPALVNCNLGDSKRYAEQYRYVKEHLRLPAEFVSTLYDCKLMRHFYSDEERSKWQRRWTEPKTEAVGVHAL